MTITGGFRNVQILKNYKGVLQNVLLQNFTVMDKYFNN